MENLGVGDIFYTNNSEKVVVDEMTDEHIYVRYEGRKNRYFYAKAAVESYFNWGKFILKKPEQDYQIF